MFVRSILLIVCVKFNDLALAEFQCKLRVQCVIIQVHKVLLNPNNVFRWPWKNQGCKTSQKNNSKLLNPQVGFWYISWWYQVSQVGFLSRYYRYFKNNVFNTPVALLVLHSVLFGVQFVVLLAVLLLQFQSPTIYWALKYHLLNIHCLLVGILDWSIRYISLIWWTYKWHVSPLLFLFEACWCCFRV